MCIDGFSVSPKVFKNKLFFQLFITIITLLSLFFSKLMNVDMSDIYKISCLNEIK